MAMQTKGRSPILKLMGYFLPVQNQTSPNGQVGLNGRTTTEGVVTPPGKPPGSSKPFKVKPF